MSPSKRAQRADTRLRVRRVRRPRGRARPEVGTAREREASITNESNQAIRAISIR